MIQQEHADAVLANVAQEALLYAPDLAAEANFDIVERVDACVESVSGADPDELRALRNLVAGAIIDPTTHREILYAFMAEHVDASDDV